MDLRSRVSRTHLLAAAALLMALGGSGCLGENAPSPQSGDAPGSIPDTGHPDNASRTEPVVDLGEHEFMVVGTALPQAIDLEIPAGAVTIEIAYTVDRALGSNYGYALGSCTNSSGQLGLTIIPGTESVEVFRDECPAPEPGPATLTIMMDAGLLEGRVQVTAFLDAEGADGPAQPDTIRAGSGLAQI